MFCRHGKFYLYHRRHFDILTIKPLLGKYWGALQAANSHKEAKDLNVHTPGGKMEKNVYSGSEPKYNVFLVYPGKVVLVPKIR